MRIPRKVLTHLVVHKWVNKLAGLSTKDRRNRNLAAPAIRSDRRSILSDRQRPHFGLGFHAVVLTSLFSTARVSALSQLCPNSSQPNTDPWTAAFFGKLRWNGFPHRMSWTGSCASLTPRR